MMKSFQLLLVIFCFTLTYAGAQNLASLSGKISAANHEPVIAATVAILKSSDSSLAKVAVSDEKGDFMMQNIPFGNYFLRVTAVGFDGYEKKEVTVDQKEMQLPEITLAQVSQSLGEVTVTAQKPLIEVKSDKTVFNVEGSINATGKAQK